MSFSYVGHVFKNATLYISGYPYPSPIERKKKRMTTSNASNQDGAPPTESLYSTHDIMSTSSNDMDVFKKDILTDIDEVWGQEKSIIHDDHKYCGIFDGVGIYKGKLTLFDYKKTNKVLKNNSEVN